MTVTIAHTELLTDRIQQLIDALLLWHKARYTHFERNYSLAEGKKYYKLMEEGSGVHAFINKATGGLINQPVSVLPLNMCVISYLMTHHFKTAYLKQTVTVAIFT
jgi:hypothetical protein